MGPEHKTKKPNDKQEKNNSDDDQLSFELISNSNNEHDGFVYFCRD